MSATRALIGRAIGALADRGVVAKGVLCCADGSAVVLAELPPLDLPKPKAGDTWIDLLEERDARAAVGS